MSNVELRAVTVSTIFDATPEGQCLVDRLLEADRRWRQTDPELVAYVDTIEHHAEAVYLGICQDEGSA